MAKQDPLARHAIERGRLDHLVAVDAGVRPGPVVRDGEQDVGPPPGGGLRRRGGMPCPRTGGNFDGIRGNGANINSDSSTSKAITVNTV